MAIHRYTKKSKEMAKGMKLIKKDFNKWDKEELSLIVDGYTARQIADYILANQKIVDRLKELSKEHKFICVCNGHCCNNHELQLETILGDKK